MSSDTGVLRSGEKCTCQLLEVLDLVSLQYQPMKILLSPALGEPAGRQMEHYKISEKAAPKRWNC
jgi:hypothetical protein